MNTQLLFIDDFLCKGKSSVLSSLTIDYTDIFLLVNSWKTKSRKFPYTYLLRNDNQKYSVCSPIINRSFLDNVPDSYTIQKYSETMPDG